jgi:hypothetical protein
MQVLRAGEQHVLWLELDLDVLEEGIRDLGMQAETEDHGRTLVVEVSAPDRDGPLLLFDASDAANTGWFSRCQFYIDGKTGAVLQTPFTVSNVLDEQGKLDSRALRVQIRKELPSHFRLPGRQPVSEQMTYVALFNFLTALLGTGVAVCGGGAVRALSGRAKPASR